MLRSGIARANHLLLQEFTIHKMTFNSNNGRTPFRVTLTDFKYLLKLLERTDSPNTLRMSSSE